MLVQNLPSKFLTMAENFVERAQILENVAFDFHVCRTNYIPIERY